jgi:hypothetical protein
MKSKRHLHLLRPAALAAATLALAATSYAQTTLLADDFTVTGTTDSYDINFNLAGRQTGTQAPQSWTGSGNAQAGNDFFSLGDANYLLVADANSRATLSGMNLASLVAANEKLVISFDIRSSPARLHRNRRNRWPRAKRGVPRAK